MNLIGTVEQLTENEWVIKPDGVVFLVRPRNEWVVKELKKRQETNHQLKIRIRNDGVLLGVKCK